MQTPIIKIPKVLKTRFHNINTLDFLALEILIWYNYFLVFHLTPTRAHWNNARWTLKMATEPSIQDTRRNIILTTLLTNITDDRLNILVWQIIFLVSININHAWNTI